MTSQLKEEENDKLMMQSTMFGATATITRAPLRGADAKATTTHAPLRGASTTTTTHAKLQGAPTDDNIDGNQTLSGGIGSNREGVHSMGVGLI